MKKLAFIAAAVVILALGGYFFFLNQSSVSNSPLDGGSKITYRCDNNQTIQVAFSENQANFSLSDGRSFSLLEVPATSGKKYTNRDGSVVLWIKDYSAFLEENDESTYTGCQRPLTGI